MYFRQFYLGCLAQASYLIGDGGEAAVVDPRRDVDEYIEEAKRQGLAIRHVIETHLHADFVSGHRELAAKTGAKIYFGAKAGARFEHVPVHEGDEIRMGNVVLRFLETPGHTPESVSVVVTDRSKSEQPEAVLTGDTLFIGDVGRPDLLGARMSAAELAGMLYDSLHGKLLKLPDATKVYPAHGAGSLCGRNISSETSSTIGDQRRFNYALQPMAREQFVGMMTADLPEAPAYFSRDVAINREGAAGLSELPAPPALTPEQVAGLQDAGALVLDTRPSAAYGTAHVPGSLHIPLSGQFASWAGALVPPEARIVLVAEDPEHEEEARVRLARVGLENVAGCLEGGIAAWEASGRPLATTEQIAVDELARAASGRTDCRVLDVRRPDGVAGGAHRGRQARPVERPAAAGRRVREGRRARRRVRQRLPLLGGDERARAQGIPEAQQRGRRNDGMDGGAGRRGETGMRIRVGVWLALLAAAGPARGAGQSVGQRVGGAQVGVAADPAGRPRRRLSLRRRVQGVPEGGAHVAHLDGGDPAPRPGGRVRGADRRRVRSSPGRGSSSTAGTAPSILIVVGSEPIVSGSRAIGTHHDSPHIDLKARPIYTEKDADNFALFKTIYYGGIKKYQWANRPLALLGRIDTAGGQARRRLDRV